MSHLPQPPTQDDVFGPLGWARTSERVADAIRRAIIEGTFRPGQTLPPERTLAERFRVTRNTVREALRHLEQLHLLSIRHGSGIRVEDYSVTAGLEIAAFLIGQAMVLHAIDRLRPAALGPVREAVEQFVAQAELESPSVRRLQELDFEIHNQLVRAGRNRVMVLLHNSMRQIYTRVSSLFEPLMRDPHELARLYRQILAALESGDRPKAKRAFQAYFAKGRESLVRAYRGAR